MSHQLILEFDSPEEMGHLIASLLNDPRVRVRITLDEVFSTEIPQTKLDRIRRNEAKPEMLRKADAKARTAWLRHKAQNTPEHQAMVAELEERRRTKLYEIQRVVDLVGCTTCHASLHRPCQSAHGTLYSDFVHKARKTAADEYEKAI